MEPAQSTNESALCFARDLEDYGEGLGVTDWIFVGIDLFLAVTISSGNGFIICILLRIRKLRTVSNYLIMQLAIADFTLGLTLVYHSAVFLERSIVIGSNLCALRYATLLLPGSASLLGLLAITVDRYIAIVDPFRYQRIQAPRYAATYALGVWIPAVVIGIVVPMGWHNPCPIECDFVLLFTRGYLQYVLIPVFIALTLTLTTLCLHVLLIARQQLRCIVDNESLPGKQNPRYIKGQFKILKAGLAVIATFYSFWLPFFLILSVQVYSGKLHDATLGICRTFSMVPIAVNSLTNPLIYAYRLPDLKAELRRLFNISTNEVMPFQETRMSVLSEG